VALRRALGRVVPELAGAPLTHNRKPEQSDPFYWSASAVVGDELVVKYAWSEVRAERLWREGVVLDRLPAHDASLPVPELVELSRDPVLVVTRMVAGEPLGWEWAGTMTASDTDRSAWHLGRFLARLHNLDAGELIGDLPFVHPTAQADTRRLREDFVPLIDERRRAMVLRWCEWVDDVLDRPGGPADVLVHGDLHFYNQVWDRTTTTLLAVVDFEESGRADPHFDLRYLAGNARGAEFLLSVLSAYERFSGRRLAVDRAMVWHVLTVLGDALWRTEAGVAFPDPGGSADTWVDDVARRLDALDLP
jgi:aminoglycoside phosphotransferase (APT) family kinase protein